MKTSKKISKRKSVEEQFSKDETIALARLFGMEIINDDRERIIRDHNVPSSIMIERKEPSKWFEVAETIVVDLILVLCMLFVVVGVFAMFALGISAFVNILKFFNVL